MTNNTDSFRAAELAMLGEIWSSPTLWPTMRTLCDDCNGRFVASDDERRAAAFIRDSLEQYGLSNAHTEEFAVNGWKRGAASLTVNGHDLTCIGLPGTPPAALEAPIVHLGDGEPADFTRVGDKAKGKIALVRGKGSHRLEKYARANEIGCVGFLFSGAEYGCLPPTGSLSFGGSPATLPGVGIAYETFLRLERMLEGQELVARLDIKSDVFPAMGLNVIADIPGSNPELGMLMACAHYDGHDIAQGAIDNASGAAAVMEAARALMKVRDQLKLGVRVALWSGEEIGMIGSGAYANAHRVELAQVKLVFNCDIVGNPGAFFIGLSGYDTDRVADFMRNLAGKEHDVNVVGGATIPYSDHFSFNMKGVPALMAATGSPKLPNMGPHTYGDTLDKVDLRALRSSTAFTARVLLHLAHDPAPLPARHATVEEVQESLRKAGYEELLKAQGRWEF
ncbi:MAG: M20/M25/M40 family metallo-hydrolase [Chloroflexi bacterium]|nr:M20/M25/M40 family metallo-hydrolase [Chloroflexota bacterium]MCL5274635.1 M20/M25/M40 family metallo-hydrolase [Chloroflexota bacterium]